MSTNDNLTLRRFLREAPIRGRAIRHAESWLLEHDWRTDGASWFSPKGVDYGIKGALRVQAEAVATERLLARGWIAGGGYCRPRVGTHWRSLAAGLRSTGLEHLGASA